MRKSLPLARTLHQAIIRQGSALLDKATIRPLRTFRLAVMKEGPDLRLFSHPSTLSRLALWLVDATRDKWAEKDAKAGKTVKSLPFVVTCLNEDKGTYLVVGVTGAPEFGDVRKKWVSPDLGSTSLTVQQIRSGVSRSGRRVRCWCQTRHVRYKRDRGPRSRSHLFCRNSPACFFMIGIALLCCSVSIHALLCHLSIGVTHSVINIHAQTV